MSAIVRGITIVCDAGPECKARPRDRVQALGALVTTERTERAARAHGKRWGWTRGRRAGVLGDWCPACSTKD